MDKILEQEKRIEQELVQYNNEHMIDNPVDASNVESNEQFAEYLHDNLHKMDQIEMRKIISRCFPAHRLKNLLLEFEFNNLPVHAKEQTLSLEQFSKEAEKMFIRYQSRAGGHCLEDREWIKHTTSSDYAIREYEVLFENTVDVHDVHNLETCNYIQRLVDILDSLSTNIKVNVFYLEKKKQSAVLVHLRAEDTLIKADATSISL